VPGGEVASFEGREISCHDEAFAGDLADGANQLGEASADRGGFGPGLAITRQAVEAQGGSITVRDLPPGGCVFAIDSPRP
jgi:K+-sensing histidine kinase KdpD